LNIFETQTDFITRDPRTDQAIERAFTAETQLARYEAWIPPQFLKDKSVLDLGCCLGAFGAYALSNGAKKYVGVEISKPLAAIADQNLTKYYGYLDNWDIVTDSCETFLENNLEEYDYIIIGGVLHAITNFLPVLTAMATCGNVIVIESVHPNIPFLLSLIDEVGKIKGKESYEHLQQLMLGVEYVYSFVGYNSEGKMMHHNNREAVSNVLSILPSMGALKTIMNRLGYKEDIRGYTTLKKAYSEHYGFGKRFLLAFVRDSEAKPMSYSELIDSEHKEIMEWKDNNAKGTI